METMANRIETLLAAKNGGNQSEMARFVGVTPQAVQKWIAGVAEPRGKNLELAATFLGVTPSTLKFGAGSGTPPAPSLPIESLSELDDAPAILATPRLIPVAGRVQAGADGYLVKSAPLPELLRRVREARGGGAPLSPEVARGLLEQLRGQAPDEGHLAVAIDGSAVDLPDGTTVDLRRRQAVRRILAALARARREHPGEPVPAQACIEAGWPGERMRWESAQARLWTSIRALRAVGLGDALETVGDGYRLVEAVRIRHS